VLRTAVSIALVAALAPLAAAQDSGSGISVPVTLSGGAMYTQRLELTGAVQSPYTAGAQLMLYPTVQFDLHWFAYAAVDFRLAPYLYYDAYNPQHEVLGNVIQAYAGYSIRTANTSLVIKAGQLASAFGSFPLRYDDAQNPLLDQPLSYIQTLTLGAGEIPCGVKDLAAQHYGFVADSCGGAIGARGLTPVTLYGLRGAELDFSGYRVDARLQVTNSSPADPLPLNRAGQYTQWTAGAGYNVVPGFRIGFSAFRGPYLEASLAPLLPSGSTLRSFPASAIGFDAQWAHGRWSASGEWQRFQYNLPNFTSAPSIVSTYGELKAVLSPRLFVAARAGWMLPGGATDRTGASASQFAPYVASYELGAGSWINRHQLLKASYEWLTIQNFPGRQLDVLGVQFVTTFHAYDRAFHQ